VLAVVVSTVLIDFVEVERVVSGGQTGRVLVGFGIPEREVVRISDVVTSTGTSFVVDSDISSVVLRLRTSIDVELRLELSTLVDIVDVGKEEEEEV
jgi:hypothetical protein